MVGCGNEVENLGIGTLQQFFIELFQCPNLILINI